MGRKGKKSSQDAGETGPGTGPETERESMARGDVEGSGTAEGGTALEDEEEIRADDEEAMDEEVSTVTADSPEDEDGFAIGEEELAEGAAEEPRRQRRAG